jgi:hypothetical protein
MRGQFQTWRRVRPAGRREGKATDWRSCSIGLYGETDGSLCTSADLKFVRHEAKLKVHRKARPITFGPAVIPTRYNRANRTAICGLIVAVLLHNLGFSATADVEFGVEVEARACGTGKARSIGEVDLDLRLRSCRERNPHGLNSLAFDFRHLNLAIHHVTHPAASAPLIRGFA